MGFPQILGVTSIRAFDHPLRPHNYVDTDRIWSKVGFEKTPFVLSAVWATRQADGSVKKEKNLMACWIRYDNGTLALEVSD